MTGDSNSSSTGDKTTIDISSPYFLTTSDHPGQNFVGDNLLRDGNFSDWKNEMSNALFAKNKIGFVDGTLPMQEENSKDLMNRKRCNAMVRGWLTSSMDKEIKNSVKYAVTARDMWVDLQERFGKENAPRAYELRRTLTLIQQENLTVSAYYTKLRGVWDEILAINLMPTCSCKRCTCDLTKEFVKLQEKERLYDFLMGLNEEYSAMKTQFLSSTPLPSLGMAYHLVSQDEQQRLVAHSRSHVNESSAFQAFGKNQGKQVNKQNSWNNKKEDRSREKKEDKSCTHCHKVGHTIDGCFELIGFPDWWTTKPNNQRPTNARQKTQPKAAQVSDECTELNVTKDDLERLRQILKLTKQKDPAPMANMAGKFIGFVESKIDNSTQTWVIDSGASEHITCHENLLKESTKREDNSSVTIPNGDSIRVKGVGNVSRLCIV